MIGMAYPVADWPPEAEAMREPVRCDCQIVYDLAEVEKSEVSSRASAWNEWRAPCCGATSNDRPGATWPGYRKLVKP